MFPVGREVASRLPPPPLPDGEGRDERTGVRWKRETDERGVTTTEHADGRLDVSVGVPTVEAGAPGPVPAHERPGYRVNGAAPCRCGCGLSLQEHADRVRRRG
jgi:hypothetical protein